MDFKTIHLRSINMQDHNPPTLVQNVLLLEDKILIQILTEWLESRKRMRDKDGVLMFQTWI